MKWLCALLVVCCAESVAAASPTTDFLGNDAAATTTGERASDALLVVGQIDRLRSGIRGGGGSLDWIHVDGDGSTLSGGVASYSLGDSRWTYGRAVGAWRIDERLIVEGQANLGAGHSTAMSFDYRVIGAGIDYRVVPEVWLKGEDKFVDIGTSRGHLLRIGALLVPTRRVSFDLGYARSVGGNLRSELKSARVDWLIREARLFTGYTRGRSVPDLFGIDVGNGVPNQALRDWFIGFALSFSRWELTGALDTIDVNASRRRTLTVSIKVPLDRGARL